MVNVFLYCQLFDKGTCFVTILGKENMTTIFLNIIAKFFKIIREMLNDVLTNFSRKITPAFPVSSLTPCFSSFLKLSVLCFSNRCPHKFIGFCVFNSFSKRFIACCYSHLKHPVSVCWYHYMIRIFDIRDSASINVMIKDLSNVHNCNMRAITATVNSSTNIH